MTKTTYLVAWMDEDGNKHWEITKTKAQTQCLSSSSTVGGKEIAIRYTGIVRSTMVCPSLMARIRKKKKETQTKLEG